MLLARGLALLVLLLGLASMGLRHASPLTWSAPLRAGPFEQGWHLTELTRTETRVQADLVRGEQRATLHLERRVGPLPPGAVEVGDYRVVSGTVHPAPPALLEAVAERVRDRGTGWTAPPPFVRATGGSPTPMQRLEQWLDELAVLLTLVAAAALGPELRVALPAVRAVSWVGLVAIGLGAAAITHALGTAGVWHANQHGYDRLFDLLHGTTPPLANLSLLHGQGYYMLMAPLVALFPGASVFDLALGACTLALVPWFLWVRMLLDDEARALLAIAVMVSTPVYLRVAPTESMYVPVLLWLGLALVAWELHLREGRVRWLFAALPPTFLAMQTRADLLLLVPAWVGWMMLARRPDWLRHTARRPAVWFGLTLAVAAFGPRLHGFVFTEKPAMTSTSVYDPLRDPRSAVLALICLLAVAHLPPIARRAAPLLSRRSARFGLGAASLAALAAWTWAYTHRSAGFDPDWTVSPLLDPGITAPWLPALAALGALRLLRAAPSTGGFLVVALAGAWLLYLPRHDCLSTYLRTTLHLTPLFGALVASALPDRQHPSPAARALVAALTLLSAVAWSAPWLQQRFPKQLQGDLLLWAVEHLPPDATVVWLADADLEPSAPAGLQLDRLHLDKYLQHLPRVVPISTWLAGGLPVDAPTFFVHTADCHRVVLHRSTPPRAWTGTEALPWRYVNEPMVSVHPRIAVEGLRDDQPFTQRACELIERASRSILFERALPRTVAGSIYEELQGSAPHLAVHTIDPRPPPDVAPTTP